MNHNCAKCGNPDAEVWHKYCNHCAHVLIKQYEAEREVMIGAIDRLSPMVKAKNEELESGSAKHQK